MSEVLTKNQFNILEKLATNSKEIDIDNCTEHELKNLEYIDENGITKKGLDVLENYRVKRAVFLAAGFGSRLVPITLNTPKPLVRVNGKRIIDSLIDAVIEAGIEEIIIVRGYLKEQFDQLLYKYPNIKFIDNDLYNKANNVSSALAAKDCLENAYVLEADLLLYNPSLIKKYHYNSNFLVIKKDITDDWCFETKDGIITKEKVGGTDCYQMVGISYWNKEDGKKLSKHLEEAYNMLGGKELYWEQVPLVKYQDKYKVEVRECMQEDIIEIDTFDELKALDNSYNV